MFSMTLFWSGNIPAALGFFSILKFHTVKTAEIDLEKKNISIYWVFQSLDQMAYHGELFCNANIGYYFISKCASQLRCSVLVTIWPALSFPRLPLYFICGFPLLICHLRDLADDRCLFTTNATNCLLQMFLLRPVKWRPKWTFL